jgi:hypothetical protein
MNDKPQDTIVRRIVIEVGRVYAYTYIEDGRGRIFDEDVFRQPFRLDRSDAIEEAEELYGRVYDHLNDTINFPSASTGGEEEQSE